MNALLSHLTAPLAPDPLASGAARQGGVEGNLQKVLTHKCLLGEAVQRFITCMGCISLLWKGGGGGGEEEKERKWFNVVVRRSASKIEHF